MTYYIENRKSSEENEKRSFGRATLLTKKIVTRKTKERKDEKDAGKTFINDRREKLWEFDIYFL